MTTLLGDTAAVTSRPANRPTPKLLKIFLEKEKEEDDDMMTLKVLSSHLNWGARLDSFDPLLNTR
jgi:hypothetical protein